MKDVPSIHTLEMMTLDEAVLLYPEAFRYRDRALILTLRYEFGVDPDGALWQAIFWDKAHDRIASCSYWDTTMWRQA